MEQIYIEIVNYLNFVIKKISPRKSLFISLDGVAPKAKLINQRERRYHKANERTIKMNFLKSHLQLEPGVISFQSNSITSGTEFMQEIDKKL